MNAPEVGNYLSEDKTSRRNMTQGAVGKNGDKTLKRHSEREKLDEAFKPPRTLNREDTSNLSQMKLRKRLTTPVWNEDQLYCLQEKEHAILMNNTKRSNKHFMINRCDELVSQKAIGTFRQQRAKDSSKILGNEELRTSVPTTAYRKSGKTADWDDYLKTTKDAAWIAPVNFFKHAPLAQDWDRFAIIGTKIEVPNPFVSCKKIVYWVATVKGFAGYKALVEYENLGTEPVFLAWISFCSDVPKPIGWCDKNFVLLFPPHEIHSKNTDFLERINSIRTASNLITITEHHTASVKKAILPQQEFKLREKVESLHLENNLDHNQFAYITGIIGDRVFVSPRIDQHEGFWFHSKSGHVHKLGWSKTIGHEMIDCDQTNELPELDSSLFPGYPEGVEFEEGMVFEVIHPIHLEKLATAHVEKRLKFGYFYARIQSNKNFDSIRFCLHITSPWILPCGFASRHDIPLLVPVDKNQENFNWGDYCTSKGVQPLNLTPMLPRPAHQFSVGCKLEAIDLRNPSCCGPATVIKQAEHLLLIHFDGWATDIPEALQWVDSESPNIYPAGWAELVGFNFHSRPEPPNTD